MSKPTFLDEEYKKTIDDDERQVVVDEFRKILDEVFDRYKSTSLYNNDPKFEQESIFADIFDEHRNISFWRGKDGYRISFDYGPDDYDKSPTVSYVYGFKLSFDDLDHQGSQYLKYNYEKTTTYDSGNRLYDWEHIEGYVSKAQVTSLAEYVFGEAAELLEKVEAERQKDPSAVVDDGLAEVKQNKSELDIDDNGERNKYLRSIIEKIDPEELKELIEKVSGSEIVDEMVEKLHGDYQFTFDETAATALNLFRRDYTLKESDHQPGRALWDGKPDPESVSLMARAMKEVRLVVISILRGIK
jgi:hypothetical protein